MTQRLLPAATALLLLGGAALAAVSLTRPDPLTQAVADGCKRDKQQIFAGNAPNWVYVNDAAAPAGGAAPAPQWVGGVADAANHPYLATHPSGGDDPLTHLSYDFNVNVLPDPQYAALVGGEPTGRVGNFAGEGEEAGRLHSEREMGSLPAFAWAEPGDRVSLLGSWVWDCDHFDTGERTEIHPYRAIWIERSPRGAGAGPSPRSPRGESEGDLFVSTDATPAGIEAECAHRTKGVDFKTCIHGSPNWLSANGRYEFRLPAPPRPSPRARLTLRIVDRGSTKNAPKLAAKVDGRGVTVSAELDTPSGARVVLAKQVFVGWAPTPARLLPEHLRLRFTRILIRRAMDPSCPPQNPSCPFANETTLLGQSGKAPGEWNVYWDVAGIWSLWKPALLLARDGQSFAGTQTVDFYVGRAAGWRLFALARECDFGVIGSFAGQNVPIPPCPRTGEIGNAAGDDYAGALETRFASPARSVGPHRTDSFVAGSDCPASNRNGCYAISYTVARIDDAVARAAAFRPLESSQGIATEGVRWPARARRTSSAG